MKYGLIVSLLAVAGLGGAAPAQGLPETVITPYRAYQEAYQAEDWPVAADSARQAYDAAIAASLEAAYATARPRDIANAVVDYQLAADTPADREQALELTFAVLAGMGGDGDETARDVLMSGLSRLLHDVQGGAGSGEAGVPDTVRATWCDYLDRRPVPVGTGGGVRVPLETARGMHEGSVIVAIEVPEAGGAPHLGDGAASPFSGAALTEAVRDWLGALEFRARCEGHSGTTAGQALTLVALDNTRSQLGEYGRHARLEYGTSMLLTGE